jgi:hypothetical protein
MTGILILAVWLALLIGFVGGSAFVAYRQEGVAIIGRRFVAEVATLLLGLTVILYVLPAIAAAFGVPKL